MSQITYTTKNNIEARVEAFDDIVNGLGSWGAMSERGANLLKTLLSEEVEAGADEYSAKYAIGEWLLSGGVSLFHNLDESESFLKNLGRVEYAYLTYWEKKQ